MSPAASAVMRAMVLTCHGGLDRLVWREDQPKPEPGSGEAQETFIAKRHVGNMVVTP